jgi:hypothetical protein
VGRFWKVLESVKETKAGERRHSLFRIHGGGREWRLAGPGLWKLSFDLDPLAALAGEEQRGRRGKD